MPGRENEGTGGRGNGGTREHGNPDRPEHSFVPSYLRSLVPPFLSAIRRLAGMPDYAAHLEHLRRCHPECRIPGERQFYEDFIRARYADGPTRCC